MIYKRLPTPEFRSLKALEARFTMVAFRATVGLQRVTNPTESDGREQTKLTWFRKDERFSGVGMDQQRAAASGNREGSTPLPWF